MTDRLILPIKTTQIRRTDGVSRTYTPDRDGTVQPRDALDAKALRHLGATTASAAGYSTAAGRSCTSCGFRGWFTTCGRCGGECR